MNDHFLMINVGNMNNLFSRKIVKSDVMGRIIQFIPCMSLANLPRLCKGYAKMNFFQKALRERKIQRQMELLRRALRNDALGSSIEQLFCSLNFDLKKLFYRNTDYSIWIIDGLLRIVSEERTIDGLMIDMLKTIADVDKGSVRKYFVKKLLWFSEVAFTEDARGFDLLKNFTICEVGSLNKKERKSIQETVQKVQRGVGSLYDFNPGDKNLFTEYGEDAEKWLRGPAGGCTIL